MLQRRLGMSPLQIGFTVDGCPVSSYSSTWRLTAGGKTDTYQRQGAATSSQCEKVRIVFAQTQMQSLVGGRTLLNLRKISGGVAGGGPDKGRLIGSVQVL
jgi:hypothetical protein